MALETLKGITHVGEYEVISIDDSMDICGMCKYVKDYRSIAVNHKENSIAFKIQDGPIKEYGHNGCDVATIIEVAKMIVEGLNKKRICRENSMAIQKLDEALMWLEKRTKDRTIRGVEGFDKE